MKPATTSAAIVRTLGSPTQIEFGQVPLPPLGDHEVRVRFLASEVNHVDLLVRSGKYPTSTPFPFIIGRDLVGDVVEVGPAVQHCSPGDLVWSNSCGYDGRQGSFASLVTVASERLHPLPSGIAPERAAAVLHTGATAALGLFQQAGLVAGQTVFIGGAGGGVGSAAVQLAHAAGARVIASTSTAHTGWVQECGAQFVLDYTHADWLDQVRQAAPEGVDVWWSQGGDLDFAKVLPLMTQGATVLISSGLSHHAYAADAAVPLPINALYTGDISVRGFVISNASVAALRQAATVVNTFLQRDVLRGKIGAEYPLAQAQAAHERLEEGRVEGRIVITP